MASSPTIPPRSEDAAVCCMCGDHGLVRELFRCRACRVRLQHSYCSNLYPRATAYRRCNWCLREPAPARQAGGAATSPAANGNDNKPAAAETKRKAASDEEQRLEGFSSRRSPPELIGYPAVKKKRIKQAGDERTPPDAGVKTGSSSAPGGSSNKEMMRAGKTRVKVRRYKLLAEVISC